MNRGLIPVTSSSALRTTASIACGACGLSGLSGLRGLGGTRNARHGRSAPQVLGLSGETAQHVTAKSTARVQDFFRLSF